MAVSEVNFVFHPPFLSENRPANVCVILKTIRNKIHNEQKKGQSKIVDTFT